MQSRLIAGLAAGILGLLSAAAPALAHHGWAGQGTEPFTVKGTVAKALSLNGPHATMQVKDATGQVWDLTLAPPARTANAGLKEDTIPVGAEVTILGKRNLDPKKFELKTERVTWNGKNFDIYPDRL
ncbi:MAG TPA: DUF6152 family protein [Gammaproteobacteria bacterium]|nr:DUF6152 family protein [Gammaproteobacteria bacterium]